MAVTSCLMKFGLNFINTIYALGGIALLVSGFYLLDTAPRAYAIYVFVVAGIAILTALLGCCGICQEHVCMTTTYASILLVGLIIQLVGRFYTLDPSGVRKFATQQVEKTWLDEIQHPGAMNKTQQTFHCCGKVGPNDYYTIGRPSLPLTCFPNQRYNQTALYQTGCIQASENNYLAFFNFASAASWGSIAVSAILVICAFYLANRFRRLKERYNY